MSHQMRGSDPMGARTTSSLPRQHRRRTIAGHRTAAAAATPKSIGRRRGFSFDLGLHIGFMWSHVFLHGGGGCAPGCLIRGLKRTGTENQIGNQVTSGQRFFGG